MRAAPLALAATLLFVATDADIARADSSVRLPDVQAAFMAYSGAQLVFQRRALPAGHKYYDRMPTLSQSGQLRAAQIALQEVRKYPRGYLGDMGLKTIGIFAALVSNKGDGYRPYDKQRRGYLYYGLWNGSDALVAAYYTDGQLPLTLHHEIFHHVDATRAGTTDYGRYFTADDNHFQGAVSGKRPYPAPTIAADELARLRKRGTGAVLATSVSGYAKKGAGEDQAETARHLMTNLADSLVQVATRPKLAGSQRLLHVMAQYRRSLALGPDVHWFIDVALGRIERSTRAQLRASIARQRARVRQRLQPTRGDSAFVVWGGEDKNGVNWTLRADVDQFGRDAIRLGNIAAVTNGGGAQLRAALLVNLRLLSRYHIYIASRWRITAGTRATFDRARTAIIAAIPGLTVTQRAQLERASYADLGAAISADGVLGSAISGINKYLKYVDAAIGDRRLRATIRRVQPATVRLHNGSGVNIAASGLILTAGHCVDRKGQGKRVEFPDGRVFRGVVTAVDTHYDLALIKLSGASGLPFATIAGAAPAQGDRVVTIGQPGTHTPQGEPTGYEPWHVSVGAIRGFLKNRLGSQTLGRTKHDAWTYWGHSGSPLFNDDGAIVALHNSWDSKTAMRHAVTWEAITDFVGKNK